MLILLPQGAFPNVKIISPVSGSDFPVIAVPVTVQYTAGVYPLTITALGITKTSYGVIDYASIEVVSSTNQRVYTASTTKHYLPSGNNIQFQDSPPTDNSYTQGNFNFNVPASAFAAGQSYTIIAHQTFSTTTTMFSSSEDVAYVSFGVKPPVVTVEAPSNSGIKLTQGDAYTISWEATNNFGFPAANYISIYYSVSGGANWILITNKEENDSGTNAGSYAWMVPPGINSSRCYVSVEASNLRGVIGDDVSGQQFEIDDNNAPRVHNITKATDYHTIYAALNDASANNIIELDDGLYYENVNDWPNLPGIVLRSGSGTSGAVKVNGQQYASVFDLSTLNPSLSGTIEGLSISLGSTEGSGGGVSLPLGSNIVVRSCIFQNNFAAYGGAVYGANAFNCTFNNNTAQSEGGGLYGASATNCQFTNNTGSFGSAISAGTATGCTFLNNTASTTGTLNNSSATNCTFTSNKAVFGGAMNGGQASGCTFTNNSASPSGSGGAIYDTSPVDKCIFTGNTANQGGAAFFNTPSTSNIVNSVFVNNGTYAIHTANSGATVNVLNCTFYNNGVHTVNGQMKLTSSIFSKGSAILSDSGSLILANYCDFQGLAFSGTGNITGDPKFTNAPNDLTLMVGSPCIDSGDPASTVNVDIAGRARPIGAYVDMGAYEYMEANINIFAPAAGASLEVGSTEQVTWEIRDQSNNLTTYPYIAVSYSTNEGANWTLIGSPANTSFISWLVPMVVSNECVIKVEAGKTAGAVSTSKISGTFSIVNSKAPVITINSNIPVFVGAYLPLTFEVSGTLPNLQAINLYFTHDNGSTFSTLATLAPSTGTQKFTLASNPATSYPSGSCWFRIVAQDLSGNISTAESSHFAIDTKAPTMEVNMLTDATSAYFSFSLKAYDENFIYGNFYTVAIQTGGGNVVNIGVSASSNTLINALSLPIKVVPPLIGKHLVTIEVFDAAGNFTSETHAVNLNMTPIPQISNVTIDKMNINTASLISKTPVISANITDYHGDLTTVEVIVSSNGQSYTFSTTPESASTTDVTAYTATINTTQVLQPGNYTVSIEAFDASGHVGSSIYSNLGITNVSSITVRPKVIPNPFRPRHGQGVTITYQLSTDTDIKLMIYDITGKAVFQKEFLAGSEGGKGPNYNNSFYWNGKDDFGKYVANGAYIYLITSDKKVLFKGQMAVMD